MTSEFGEVMKVLRESAGLSLFGLAKRITWSKAAVGHAESGLRAPTPELARAIDRALGANGVLIAVAATMRTRRRNVSDVDRRDLLRLLASTGVATAAELGDSEVPGRLGGTDVARALERTKRLRRLDDSLGGADTYGLFLAEVRSTEATLVGGSLSGSVRRQLLAVLAEQAQLAGWAAFDAGWSDKSTRLFAMSRQAALEAEEPALVANAMALDAYQRAFSGRVDVALARASCAALTDAVPGLVRALVFDRAAWSHAVAGDADQAEAALAEAAAAVESAVGSPEPDWAAWVDAHEIDIMTGRCWSVLGRPLRAVAPLESALSVFPDAYARDKALYLLALAEAYLHGRELELAAQTIRQAHMLTKGVASDRPRHRLNTTLTLAAPFATVKPFKELHEHIAGTSTIPR
ncbi:helix-turn-helix transcriptional regulator [Catellatospora coxensis]|uniref:HTH cro/C1-type domain-containing protein n=1 Tax=Catellatospora coxensis TaxID=310354 RepID=A0A8J3P4G3_9ACTN|nr:helix-turn-helix transcriptional regulator [Catellatospora coxensis]GIG03334.1 hypothetical protein Cco03nite_00340 [Catellatospora coxensis]